ncbi:carbonic anhydrase [Litorimonas taeanensis]|uniref:Carbonic anhydrase n=1 Tax=Litorimonas taeanensis TaxID=568099 RepID=A0A420WJV8_9PROT|nr:carbonic anhydrase [Litorimonas taeanensis]RKQ71311.1 carbonic anhydrase [Litorimonas taeanensis]
MTHPKEALIAGYKSFRAGDYAEQKSLYETLGTHGQNPKIMIIACADSRVDPTDIFNAYPGEMFVVRNVANIVPPLDPTGGYHGTSASIEFAVKALKVECIVVMGHESCGGIQGCLQGMGQDENAGYVGRWLSLINGVRETVVGRKVPEDEMQFEMELENVRQSLTNLMTFDFVREAVANKTLTLQGAYFSIIRARLLLSDEAGVFSEVESV